MQGEHRPDRGTLSLLHLGTGASSLAQPAMTHPKKSSSPQRRVALEATEHCCFSCASSVAIDNDTGSF